MALSKSQVLTQYFYDWEQWGRGLRLSDQPVVLEPPLVPFNRGNVILPAPDDDGFSHTPTSWLRAQFFPKKGKPSLTQPEPTVPQVLADPYQTKNPDHEICEYQVRWTRDRMYGTEAMHQLLVMLSGSTFPISFEIIGTHDEIFTQLACRLADAARVESLVPAYFPGILIQKKPFSLYSRLEDPHETILSLELTLDEEFMRPIRVARSLEPDPLTGVVAALESLRKGQLGMVQILFQGTKQSWAPHMLASVTDGNGGDFFMNAPEMIPLVREKIAAPLLAVNIRVVGIGGGEDLQDSFQVAYSLAQALEGATSRVGSNRLAVVENNLEEFKQKAAALFRKSYRPGMILNTQELLGLVHFLAPSVVSSKFEQQKKSKKAAQEFTRAGYILGTNTHEYTDQPIGLSTEDRLRHVHVIGATGTGKSTLLINLIRQDILSGTGCAVFDPHGDLIDDVMLHIPVEMSDKVVLIDPSDSEYAVGVNILEAKSEPGKVMLASDLAAVFKRHTTSWGDQMEVIIQNTIAAFLESEKGGSLLDLRRFLLDTSFREEFLETVKDPMIQEYFWYDFPQKRNSSLQSILSRLQFFLRPKPIRYMLMQREGLDFAKLMYEGYIILCRLSQGLIGESNSYLLGSLLLTKVYQAAIARQAHDKFDRKPFYVYLDEFKNFITPTLAATLSGARKYGLGLVLAHQSLDQVMQRDQAVGHAVLANAGTRISFRVSEGDAHQLAKGLSFFEADDIQGLSVGEAIVRIGSSQHDYNIQTDLPPSTGSHGLYCRGYVRTASQHNFGKEITELEENYVPLRRPKRGKEVSEPVKPKVEPIEVSKEELTPEPEPRFEAPQPQQDIEAFAKAEKEKSKKKQALSEHRYLQTYLKQMAEARGYRAVIEAETPNKQGRVDVLLVKGEKRIAVEIAVTTTNQHELGNIRKCLTAGYSPIIWVTQKEKRLQNLEALTKQELSDDELKHLLLFTPTMLFAWLDQQDAEDAQSEQTVKGYRVKVKYKTLSEEESQAKQDRISKIIGDSVKRKKK